MRGSHGAKDAFHKHALNKYTIDLKNTSAVRFLMQRRRAGEMVHLVNACCTSKGCKLIPSTHIRPRSSVHPSNSTDSMVEKRRILGVHGPDILAD